MFLHYNGGWGRKELDMAYLVMLIIILIVILLIIRSI